MSTTAATIPLAGPAHEWAGSLGALRALAEAHRLEPWSGSPLLGSEPAPGRTVPTMPAGFGAALLRLAQPELRLDITHLPPGHAAHTSCYAIAGNDWYACHWVDGDLHRVAWPVTPGWLARLLLDTVGASGDAASVGLRFSCDRAGYEAIVALVDLLQHESLVALLEGRPVRDLGFDATDLLAAFLRPRAQRDLRWMTARAQRMAPAPLAPSPQSLEAALAALARAGCVRRSGEAWQVEPGLRTACGLLGAVSGWLAVSRRTRQRTAEGGIAWRREHAAALRALDTLWIFEFAQFAATDFRVDIGDAPPASVRALVERLLAPLAPARPAGAAGQPPAPRAPAPAVPSEPGNACRACGNYVRPGVKFCTHCGAKL